MTSDYVVITINGKLYGVSAVLPLTYRDIADVAGFKSPRLPSMTVRLKGSEGRIVHPGGGVAPAHGLIFNVADTGNA